MPLDRKKISKEAAARIFTIAIISRRKKKLKPII
jgi:hypothetical protein